MKSEVGLTVSRLKELLDYDPATGVFTWKVRRSNVSGGSVAGRTYKNGYRYIRVDSQDYLAQRLAWMYMTGEWPKAVLRFKNRNISDLSYENIYDTVAPPPGKWDHRTAEGRSAYNKARRAANPDHHRDR